MISRPGKYETRIFTSKNIQEWISINYNSSINNYKWILNIPKSFQEYSKMNFTFLKSDSLQIILNYLAIFLIEFVIFF